MQFSTLWVASAAVLATLVGSFVVAPFIGRLLTNRQPPPMPQGVLVSTVEGDPCDRPRVRAPAPTREQQPWLYVARR